MFFIQAVLRLMAATVIALPVIAQSLPAPVSPPGNDSIGGIASFYGKTTGAERVTLFSKTAAYRTALTAIEEKVSTAPLHEHTIAFGRDTNGAVVLSMVSTGGRSSSPVPVVPNVFSDLHNHPRNTPPSSGDLYGLLHRNKKDYRCNSRYVITPQGSTFALLVTDTAAARAFIMNFPPQQMRGYSPLFPEALLDEFREIRYLHGAAEELAMAYILGKYNAGIALLKQDRVEDVFRKVSVLVRNTGSGLLFTAVDTR